LNFTPIHFNAYELRRIHAHQGLNRSVRNHEGETEEEFVTMKGRQRRTRLRKGRRGQKGVAPYGSMGIFFFFLKLARWESAPKRLGLETMGEGGYDL
jgi:hypothetical protein